VKVAAHPLVVAVALGLIGPSALEGLQTRRDAGPAASTLDVTTLEAPADDEISRVAEAFAAARERV
jgi:hypothetical protein